MSGVGSSTLSAGLHQLVAVVVDHEEPVEVAHIVHGAVLDRSYALISVRTLPRAVARPPTTPTFPVCNRDRRLRAYARLMLFAAVGAFPGPSLRLRTPRRRRCSCTRARRRGCPGACLRPPTIHLLEGRDELAGVRDVLEEADIAGVDAVRKPAVERGRLVLDPLDGPSWPLDGQ